MTFIIRKLLRNSIIISFILALFVQCRKDKTYPESPQGMSSCDSCADFPTNSTGFGWQYINEGVQYTDPCYNPNNTDEFVYVKVKEDGDKELVKFNLVTMSEVIILDSIDIVSKPSWASTGWITFSDVNKKVWRLTENGTNLVQVTSGVSDISPHFTNDGNLICYFRNKNYSNSELQANPNLYLDYKMMFIDINGTFVDSILIENVNSENGSLFYYQDWTICDFTANGVYFAGGTDNYYGIYKINSSYSSKEAVITWGITSNKDFINDITSSASGHVLAYSKYRNNLLIQNTLTGDTLKCITGCDTEYYEGISITPNGEKILVEKVCSEVLNSSDIKVQSEIWSIELFEPFQSSVILKN